MGSCIYMIHLTWEDKKYLRQVSVEKYSNCNTKANKYYYKKK